ncbi:LysR family transcriptional regulator [Microvirga arabica]|uniref:LysR family transcriptional regulator n=1 Tax=Microvirga arabica TaxID=1128671 RepID=UPI001FEB0F7E|nr:LysR family transcriptional regulator [Microvirga arabica]
MPAEATSQQSGSSFHKVKSDLIRLACFEVMLRWSLMEISSRQIEAFRAVMLTGSITSASEALFVTQPAVSRLIRSLEESTGLILFERRGNHVVPTAEATALLEEVERSFVGLARIGAFAQALRAQTAGSLRIAAMPALAGSILTRFVARFSVQRPDVHITVSGVPSHLVLDAVASGQADFGYADSPLDRAGLEIETIPVAAVAVMRKDHPLARRRSIKPADLRGERFVGIGPGTFFRSRIDMTLADIPRTISLETPLSHIACLLVAEGGGISLVDPYSAAEFLDKGIVAKPFTPFIDSGFVSLRSRQHSTSALAVTFVREFREYVDRLHDSRVLR